jgi:LAO/AO transport system kinase
MRTRIDLDELADGVRSRDRTMLGRAITLVESNRPDHLHEAQELLRRLLPDTGRSHRIGISGVPGAGKSTFIESFGLRLVDGGHRVAVLAVDPSSALSGGSILGDKTRMERLANRDEAFIRPSPAGGSLGGVARTTRETLLLCEAAGFDVILVETVGVGQSEAVVAEMVDVFLLLMLSGAGDELQGIKRGNLEVADILAINKADGANRERALRARAELEGALQILAPGEARGWRPRVVACSAATGEGLDDIWSLVRQHHDELTATGVLERRRREQRVRWMWAMVDDRLRTSLRSDGKVRERQADLEDAVRRGRMSASEAADELLRLFGVGDDDPGS